MKIAEMNMEQLEKYINELNIRLHEGSDERNEIELATKALDGKKRLQE